LWDLDEKVCPLAEAFVFRGYQLRNLAEGLAGRLLGPRLAIVIAWLFTSTLFGVAHATNSNATVLSTLNIVLAGLLLSLPYLLTGELAISIGLHLTWNLFQGTVYGFPVSGSLPSRHLLSIEQSGPDLWTGGAFGPEAGLLTAIWVLIGCTTIPAWIWLRRKQLGICVSVATYERA
jgi:membrane protease YdiL (CAAX protease family)